MKYPSFKLQFGRPPVAGKDYDPNDVLCQDDYEYLTGTGRYTNNPDETTKGEPTAGG